MHYRVSLKIAVGVWCLSACAARAQTTSPRTNESPTAGSDGKPLADDVVPIGPTPSASGSESLGIPIEAWVFQIPDPETDRERVLRAAEEARESGDASLSKTARRVLELLDRMRRPDQLHLSLQEVIRRALSTSYAIEVERYNPAVEATRVAEAKAAFDAVFFSTIEKNNANRPTGTALAATDSDTLTTATGVRKKLLTGMLIGARYELNRSQRDFQFQLIDPEYTSGLVIELTQPLLRGFGLDYNRSLIVLAENTRRSNEWAFRRNVRDIVRQVEEAYWRLAQARRDIVISARLLVEFEQILNYLEARAEFDTIPVQLNATEANLETTRAEYLRKLASVCDAEDQLIALMNSEDVDLADDIEIVPTDFPQIVRIAVDRLGAVQTALDHRAEIREQQLLVENARIGIGQAKNEELPKLDLTLAQTSAGLGISAHDSFDQASQSNFISYRVAMQLEVPIGNRAAAAASRRACMEHAQAVANLKRTYEEVILNVNTAVRKLNTAYDNILPTYKSAVAREREVQSIVARAERKDFNTLTNELASRQSLAESRRQMLAATIEYNIAIIDLEQAKGTLLDYNNIVIPVDDN